MEELYYDRYFREEDNSLWSAFKKGFKILIFIFIVGILITPLCGIKGYFVGGWSMEPTIHYMSLILVDTNLNKTKFEVGDIITFKMGIVNTHRIIEVKKDANGVTYITQGDNRKEPDNKEIKPNEIFGKVVCINEKPLTIPNIGYPILYIQQNPMIFAIYLILLYVFFFMIPRPEKYVGYSPEV